MKEVICSTCGFVCFIVFLFSIRLEVVLSNPGYACYRNFVLAAQAKPVLVPLSEEKGLQYDIEAIRKCVFSILPLFLSTHL